MEQRAAGCCWERREAKGGIKRDKGNEHRDEGTLHALTRGSEPHSAAFTGGPTSHTKAEPWQDL